MSGVHPARGLTRRGRVYTGWIETRRDKRPQRFSYPALALIAGAVVLLALGGTWLAGLVPSIGNPFSTETIDRSGPAVLEAVQDISEYRAATGHFQVIVDLEEDTRFIPSEIRGERTLFVAAGTVDAGVDLSALGAGAVRVSDDRSRVTVTLPAPRLYDAQVDPERSYVANRDRGLLDRIGSAFRDSPSGERELYLVAEARIAAAARETELLEQAARNTRAMLSSLLTSLGFESVDIRFAEPEPT